MEERTAYKCLAWTWVACLGLLLLTAYTPLQLNSITKRIWAVLLVWMLPLFFTPYFGRRTSDVVLQRLLYWWPRVQWAGTGILLVLVLLTAPLMGPPLVLGRIFPAHAPDYTNERPLLSRGSEQVYQVHLDNDPHAYLKPVRVRYLPALLVWVSPLPLASLDSTWQLHTQAGLEFLAPRYRQAAATGLPE